MNFVQLFHSKSLQVRGALTFALVLDLVRGLRAVLAIVELQNYKLQMVDTRLRWW